jgi:ferredoxin
MKKSLKLKDVSKDKDKQLIELDIADLIPLPPPYDKAEEPPLKEATEDQRNRLEFNLDGYSALTLPKPKNKEEEKKYTDLFISGLKKLFKKEDNWTFLQPLLLSIEYCAQCQTCNDACPIYIASGKNDLYRPTYRSEIFRRLIKKYIKPGGTFWQKLNAADIDLNWATISRLYELAYRCTLCRRCTQT